MSVPWVIIGLGAVGGLWVAKAGPFAPTVPAGPTLSHEPTAGSSESAPSEAAGYQQPAMEHEPTTGQEAMASIATAPPDAPTVHQVSTNLQNAANTVQVGTDSLGVTKLDMTDGTKTGGTARMSAEEAQPIELPAQMSVEESVFGGARGLTPRDIGRATNEWGPMMGLYW